MKIRINKKKFIKTVFIFILLIVLITVFVLFLKPKTIDQTTFKGVIKEEIIFEKQESEFMIKDSEFTPPNAFIKYTDRYKTTLTKQVDPSFVTVDIKENKLAIISDNKITLNDTILTGEKIHITLRYKSKKQEYTYIVKYDLSKTIGEDKIVKNSDSIDVMVNKKRHLSKDFVPKNLREVNVKSNKPKGADSRKMNSEAADHLEALFKCAKEDGYDLCAVSGYRSYSTQQGIFSSNVSSKGSEQAANRVSARAGESEHQTGLAMDVSAKSVNYGLVESFGKTEEGKWLKENAYKYGFIIRYPKGKEDITGYAYEPWHIRYVGETLAKEIQERDITLEEFFELK